MKKFYANGTPYGNSKEKIPNTIKKSLEGVSYKPDFFITGLAEYVTIFQEIENSKSKPLKISKAYGVFSYLSAFIIHFDSSLSLFRSFGQYLDFTGLAPPSFYQSKNFNGYSTVFPFANFFRHLKLCLIDSKVHKTYRKIVLQYYIFQITEYLCRKCDCEMDEFVCLIDKECDIYTFPWTLCAAIDEDIKMYYRLSVEQCMAVE